MNNKAVLAVGTVIVVLNILLAMGAVVFIEFAVQQYELQQKLIIIDQDVGLKCTSIIREAINDEYSRRDDDHDSISVLRAVEFYGEPEPTDYKSKKLTEQSNLEISICGDTDKEIIECQSNLPLKPALVSCETLTYHPELANSKIKLVIQ